MFVRHWAGPLGEIAILMPQRPLGRSFVMSSSPGAEIGLVQNVENVRFGSNPRAVACKVAVNVYIQLPEQWPASRSHTTEFGFAMRRESQD